MSESNSDRRLAENEVLFREFNENVQKRFDEFNAIALADKQNELMNKSQMPLHFYCECSDENCRERIEMAPKLYNKIHIQRDVFIIKPSHRVARIEDSIDAHPDYEVIRKKMDPPSHSGGSFNTTSINNV